MEKKAPSENKIDGFIVVIVIFITAFFFWGEGGDQNWVSLLFAGAEIEKKISY